MAALGVPGAGPADPVAHRLANDLVGNRPGTAALEVTARGPVLRARSPVHIAVTGGGLTASVDGFGVETGRVLPIAAGQRVVLGTTRAGLRGYSAVAGGFVTQPVLGSCSTDMLSGLGPGPLVAGDGLAAAVGSSPMADHLLPGAPDAAASDRRVLRVLPGPHPEWFPPDSLERFVRRPYLVEQASDRVGMRLRAVDGQPLARRRDELHPQGMVTGAVQVPPDGRPVVLLPDHATLGGYPVLAVVIAADHCVLGQCRPGDTVEFRLVGPAEARRRWPRSTGPSSERWAVATRSCPPERSPVVPARTAGGRGRGTARTRPRAPGPFG